MKKIVRHYWASGGTYEFNSDTGRLKRVPDDTPMHEWGIAWRQGRKWFVLHNDDEHLILQHKTHVWPITPEYTVDVNGFWVRRFTIRKGKDLIYSLRYVPKSLGLIASFVDPTYDGMDAESDDYFLYVKSMWEDWMHRDIGELKEVREVSNKAL